MSGEETQSTRLIVYVEHEEKAKNNNIEMSELEKREIIHMGSDQRCMYHDYFLDQHVREEHPYPCQEGKQTT